MIPLNWRLKRKRYLLIGGKCRSCGVFFYPIDTNCLKCNTNDIEEVKLPGDGIVESFTIIWVAPKGFEPPYVLGIIKLDCNTRVLSEIITSDDIKIGDSVQLVFRKLSGNDNGVINYGLKFEKVV